MFSGSVVCMEEKIDVQEAVAKQKSNDDETLVVKSKRKNRARKRQSRGIKESILMFKKPLQSRTMKLQEQRQSRKAMKLREQRQSKSMFKKALQSRKAMMTKIQQKASKRGKTLKLQEIKKKHFHQQVGLKKKKFILMLKKTQ
jgi:hypothetical protein